MRPYLLKGHSRPLAHVRYNRDGDLLFTCAKDHTPCVWYVDNGERLGTFNGHNGSVYAGDISFNTEMFVTGSADRTVKLWNVRSGTELATLPHKSTVRTVMFSTGDRMVLSAQDSSFGQKPTIFIYNVDEVLNEERKGEAVPIKSITEPETGKMSTALWGDLNQTIIAGCDDGTVRVWDTETGQQVKKVTAHRKKINHVQFSYDRTMFLTASADQTAKLWDAKTCTLMKTYVADRPLNSAHVSPIMNHVIIGGGQDAMDVTTTDSRAGHFEVDFFHTVYQEKLGAVSGHFGPVNTVAFAPDGRSFASGGEDGYIRLHHFDKEYFDSPKW